MFSSNDALMAYNDTSARMAREQGHTPATGVLATGCKLQGVRSTVLTAPHLCWQQESACPYHGCGGTKSNYAYYTTFPKCFWKGVLFPHTTGSTPRILDT